MSRFRFIAVEKALYPVVRLCLLLKVSASGFYAWVRRKPRGRQPTTPASRIKRATRFRPTGPVSRRSAWTRGDPYVPRLRAWTARIRPVSAAFATDRADGGRFAQA